MANFSESLTFCFCVLFAFQVVFAPMPRIVQDIRVDPAVLNIGDTAVLECVTFYADKNPVSFHFITNGAQLTHNGQVKYHKSVDGRAKYEVRVSDGVDKKKIFTLYIHALKEFDNGEYACQIDVLGSTDINTRRVRRSKNITVLVPPNIDFTNSSSTVTIAEGKTGLLRCSASGIPKPTLKWKRVNGLRLPSGALISQGPTLLVQNVSRQHAGLYRCTAENTVVPINRTHNIYDIKLDVQFAPHATPVRAQYGQVTDMNQMAMVECYIEGNPAPTVYWQRYENDGWDRCDDNNRYEVQEFITHGSYMREWRKRYVLIIKSVGSGNDFTHYKCFAWNDYGSGEAVIRLYKTNECQGVFCRRRVDTRSLANMCSATIATMAVAYLVLLFC